MLPIFEKAITYQSSKYTAATSKSDAVVVEFVKAKTVDVAQNSTKQITVTFSEKVSALAVADVTVNKMINEYAYAQVVKSVKVAEDGMSATVVVFNSFADKANYTVKVKGFDDATFVASVGVPTDMKVVAKDKNPSNIITTNTATEIVAKFYDANGVDVTDSIDATTIVTFKLEKAATSGEYFLTNKKLTIKKNTASAVIVANYRGRLENGKMVGALEAKEEFFAVDAAAVTPVSVSAYDLDGNWYNGVDKHSLQLNESGLVLALKLVHSNNQNANAVYNNGTAFNNNPTKEKITITAATPEIAEIAGTTILPRKAGTAQFYVNYSVNQNGRWNDIPFDVITIDVLENAVVASVKFDNANLFIGTADQYLLTDGTATTDYNNASYSYATDEWGNKKQAGFSFGLTNLLGTDQRGNRVDLGTTRKANMTLKCLSDGFGNGVDPTYLASGACVQTWAGNQWDGKSDNIGFKVLGTAIRDYFASKGVLNYANNGESITLDYEATFKNAQGATMTAYFTVTVQEPGAATDNYIELKTSTQYIDITKKNADGLKDTKVVTFQVFEKNNGVIVDTIDVAKYNAAAATRGAYQYKIFKDGQDITNNTTIVSDNLQSADYPYSDCKDVLKNHRVDITLSSVKTDDKAATATGNANALLPDYTVGGAGNYTFVLYKWDVNEANELYDVPQLQSDVTAVLGSAGAYTINHDAQRSNSVYVTGSQVADAKNILKCFTIKDNSGNDVVAYNASGVLDVDNKYKYYVVYDCVSSANTVYVKEIVFYESLQYTSDNATKNANQYVAFTVPVDVVLEKALTAR